MFTQCDTFRGKFQNLSQFLIEGVRHYGVDDQTAYPSITSVISWVNRKKWAEWRQRVGVEEANRKNKKATNRGTGFHSIMEEFMANNDVTTMTQYSVPLLQLMFKSAKPYLEKHITNVYQQETRMCSHKMCLAGTVDLICDFDGELSIVDFKTSEKEKPEEWLEDYFVQLSAYWAMFAETTDVVPKKLVVFLVAENGDVQIVERKNIMDYLETLRDYVSQFVQHHNALT
tara:strand:+ start:1523 stop:2209 length:687 start_codon:yes stop_codon:yes gene_type:complete